MSPEQAGGRPVDPRADVYALGAILYHVLAGTPPQPAPGDPAGAPARQVPLVSLEPRLPPDLLAIVDKALAADIARRYPSAFELADDLKRFAGGQLVAARRYSPLARAGRFVARHPVAVGVALAVAAALLALAALSFGSRRCAQRDGGGRDRVVPPPRDHRSIKLPAFGETPNRRCSPRRAPERT